LFSPPRLFWRILPATANRKSECAVNVMAIAALVLIVLVTEDPATEDPALERRVGLVSVDPADLVDPEDRGKWTRHDS
jgi:hypothetical protein